MLNKKSIFIIAVVSCLVISGGLIYFIEQFTSFYPPLETYRLRGGTTQFIESMKKLSTTDTTIDYQITDTIGPISNIAYFMEIDSKSNGVTFMVKIKDVKVDEKDFVELSLHGVYDQNRNLQVYQNNDNGAPELVGSFEEFLDEKFPNNYH